MSTPPQLPAGYEFEDQQAAGPPKLPKGYAFVHPEDQAASSPPPPPSYLSEIASGAGRAAKSLLYDMPKQLWEYNKTLPGGVVQGVAQDLWKGVTQSGQASEQAKQQGEGKAGQALAALENYPVIGGMVRKAEEAGPGYAKLAPQTLGAATEAALTFEGPQLTGKALSKLHEVLPSLPRSGQAIGMIRDRIGAAPTGGMNGLAFEKANAELNTLDSTGQPVPGPLKAFVEGVQSGTAPKIDIESMLNELETLDPKAAAKARMDLAKQEFSKGPPRPDSGVVDPNTFAGLTKFRTVLNAWKYERSLPAASRNALGAVADAMATEAQQIANREGVGAAWNKYQTEYASGKGAIRKAAQYGPKIGQGVGMAVGGIAPELLPQVSGVGARTTAGLGGAFAGMKVGEKIGALAEPITKTIVNRPGTPRVRALPPSPESYTRTLLEAKEGLITPEEANRRIQRGGGSVKTRRIPQPTGD